MDTSRDSDALARVVMLAFGLMEDGSSPYWCYVAVKPSRLEEFRRAMASGKYNIQHFADDGYGEVIVSGAGKTPPDEVTRQVADFFGVPVADLFKDAHPEHKISDILQQINNNPPAS